MDRDQFESEVVALAADGTALTVANVAARTRMPPRKVEAMLDEMQRGGHLDTDVDEREGVVVYRMKGLTAGAAKKRVAVDAPFGSSIMSSASEVLVRQTASRARAAVMQNPQGGRSVLLGIALGGVFGPLGLLYAAPWITAILGILGYAVAFWVLGWIAMVPILGSLIKTVCLVAAHLASAALGGMYARRFNKMGRRAALEAPGKGMRLRDA